LRTEDFCESANLLEIVTQHVSQWSMPNLNMRQLRDTRKLKAWLRAGKTVELRDRDKVIARIIPALQPEAAGELPDFAARRKDVFGDRVLPGADLLIEDRGRY
jgi:antitoxin (DNA-binding transcriptional repressor) of toxin-antitoxin stability system